MHNYLFFCHTILQTSIVVHRSLAEKLYFCTRCALHVSAKIQPEAQRDEWYYRIKESFRDLTDHVRSRVMLNVGFIEEAHRPEEIRDIGKLEAHTQLAMQHLAIHPVLFLQNFANLIHASTSTASASRHSGSKLCLCSRFVVGSGEQSSEQDDVWGELMTDWG